MLAVAAAVGIVLGVPSCGSSSNSTPSPQPGLPRPPNHRRQPLTPQPSQVELPFTGLNSPGGVAVDTAGNVYVADHGNNRVLKLAAGSTTPTVLPFTGLNSPGGVAVDTAGTVYVADTGNNRVLKLAAGSTSQTVLPFTGLNIPTVWRWTPPAPSTSPTRTTTGC